MQKSLTGTLTGTLAAAVLALGMPLAAFAQDGACRDDAARLCPDARPGRARLACLAQKRDELSDACRARLEQARSRAGGKRQRLEACRPDLERLCAGVEPGNGALRRCLAEHRDEVSEQCRAQLGAARGEGGTK